MRDIYSFRKKKVDYRQPAAWEQQAECRKEEYAHLEFVPDHGQSANNEQCAIACLKCPVSSDCLDRALSDPDIKGIYGAVLFEGKKPRRITIRAKLLKENNMTLPQQRSTEYELSRNLN